MEAHARGNEAERKESEMSSQQIFESYIQWKAGIYDSLHRPAEGRKNPIPFYSDISEGLIPPGKCIRPSGGRTRYCMAYWQRCASRTLIQALEVLHDVFFAVAYSVLPFTAPFLTRSILKWDVRRYA